MLLISQMIPSPMYVSILTIDITKFQDGECFLPDVTGSNPLPNGSLINQTRAKPCSRSYIGDGTCYDSCNNLIFDFEGGDCCEPHLNPRFVLIRR